MYKSNFPLQHKTLILDLSPSPFLSPSPLPLFVSPLSLSPPPSLCLSSLYLSLSSLSLSLLSLCPLPPSLHSPPVISIHVYSCVQRAKLQIVQVLVEGWSVGYVNMYTHMAWHCTSPVIMTRLINVRTY